MMKKLVLRGALLTAAVGGPIALFAGPDWWDSFDDGSPSPADAVAEEGHFQTDPDDGPPSDVSSLEGAPVEDLAGVFSFEVTTDWILRRWPRVSTGLARPQLQGYRVPLVTGTTESDLAGSLTYYFNSRQKVQQITFHGKTGDPRKLVRMLAARHKFTRRVVNDPGLFIYEAVSPDGRPNGVLKLQSARIVKASDPYRRFDVELQMERPS